MNIYEIEKKGEIHVKTIRDEGGGGVGGGGGGRSEVADNQTLHP